MTTRLGEIAQLALYPVKSMRGLDVDVARVTYTGFVGDRVHAFVDDVKKDDARGSQFPWHSARQQAEMLLYQASFRAPLPLDRPYPDATAFQVDITTPDGRTLDLADPALIDELARKSGCSFQRRFSEKGMQDARPVSLFSMQTLEQLSTETGRKLDPRRFRANIYPRWDTEGAFFEDSLVGKRLRIGETVEMTVVKKDPRCTIISLDPETAEAHPEVLTTVARLHKGCAGVYAAVLREGTVRVGDAIQLLD